MIETQQNGVLLKARGVHKAYKMGVNVIEVLKGVSIDVKEGETLAIMGASGAGKSTFLHILGALDRPSAGTVQFKGREVYSLANKARAEIRALKMGFVFQSYHLLPELDVLENVMLPSMSRFGAWGKAEENRQRARTLLEKVGLGERAHHRPMELSGGEQQRTAIARALMNSPDVILADEPTGNLDSTTGEQVLQYLFDLTVETGHTLMLVTHNEAVAGRCARQMVLKDGCLA